MKTMAKAHRDVYDKIRNTEVCSKLSVLFQIYKFIFVTFFLFYCEGVQGSDHTCPTQAQCGMTQGSIPVSVAHHVPIYSAYSFLDEPARKILEWHTTFWFHDLIADKVRRGKLVSTQISKQTIRTPERKLLG